MFERFKRLLAGRKRGDENSPVTLNEPPIAAHRPDENKLLQKPDKHQDERLAAELPEERLIRIQGLEYDPAKRLTGEIMPNIQEYLSTLSFISPEKSRMFEELFLERIRQGVLALLYDLEQSGSTIDVFYKRITQNSLQTILKEKKRLELIAPQHAVENLAENPTAVRNFQLAKDTNPKDRVLRRVSRSREQTYYALARIEDDNPYWGEGRRISRIYHGLNLKRFYSSMLASKK